MVVRTVAEEAEASVLCWVATVSPDGTPNVSPKEVFAILDAGSLVVADIASPITVRNLRANPMACVSFVDVFRQTGYKLLCEGDVVTRGDDRFAALAAPLTDITQGVFEIRHVLHLKIRRTAPIVAPSYRLHPDRSISERIADTMRTYGVQPIRGRASDADGAKEHRHSSG